MKIEVLIGEFDPKIVEIDNNLIVKSYNDLKDANVSEVSEISEDELFEALVYSKEIIDQFIGDSEVEEFDIKILD